MRKPETPRYTVVKHWHDQTEIVATSNKRRTAVRRCAEENAANLSHVSWYEVVARNGRPVRVSGQRARREASRGGYRYQTGTVAYRGVW